MSGRALYLAGTGNMGPVGAGVTLDNVIVGTGAVSGVLTIYDGQDATTGDVVAVIDATAFRYIDFDVFLSKGLFAVISGGAAKVTLTYC